jgi:hypothetical protein
MAPKPIRAMSFGTLLKPECYARIDLGAIIVCTGRRSWPRHWESTKPSTRPMRIAPRPRLAGTTLRRRQNPIWAEGIPLYVKASLSGGGDDYQLDYKRRNRTFPHETTGDHFFDDDQ